MCASGFATVDAQTLSKHAGIPSGPVALFVGRF